MSLLKNIGKNFKCMKSRVSMHEISIFMVLTLIQGGITCGDVQVSEGPM